ncbi:MAG: ferrous iron transport protein B [Candidatus Hadarchaeota archaeon]
MDEEKDAGIVVGLAGNPNVGKSAFFHQVTGLGVTVSNYPGTTVEVAEGMTRYDSESVKIVDLPGVYSLGAVSEDEKVARKAILDRDIDVILNIVDASNLERNLYLTFQLIELGLPVVLVLNQYDEALEKGLRIDPDELSNQLGVPVVETVATEGKNVLEAFEMAVESGKSGDVPERAFNMGEDLESIVQNLADFLEGGNFSLPFYMSSRTLAIKLLEGDEEMESFVLDQEGGEEIIGQRDKFAEAIRKMHGEEAAFRIARERHGLASLISEEVTNRVEVETPLSERISRWTTELKTGVPIMIGVFLGLLAVLFFGGEFIEEQAIGNWEGLVEPGLRSFFQNISPNAEIAEVLDIGINQGIKGILAVMLPYLPPFFFALAILEDSGYLPRMAFVMDSVMHRMGLHGKAVAPMLGGFGCNVPAIMATRGLTGKRQRFIASFLITMVPCSARTAVILGTVGIFVGLVPALSIYAVILALIFAVGLALNRFIPGETTGMVMEMPPLRRPMLRPVLTKTWNRLREFIYVATPLLLVGSFVIGILDVGGIMNSIVDPLSPLTLGLLGLPPVVIVPLIYGIIRKEGALVLLVSVAGTSQLGSFMSDLQLYVFALVVAIYLPCIAAFAVLRRELGWKEAVLISVSTVIFAIAIGSIFLRLNPLGLAS